MTHSLCIPNKWALSTATAAGTRLDDQAWSQAKCELGPHATIAQLNERSLTIAAEMRQLQNEPKRSLFYHEGQGTTRIRVFERASWEEIEAYVSHWDSYRAHWEIEVQVDAPLRSSSWPQEHSAKSGAVMKCFALVLFLGSLLGSQARAQNVLPDAPSHKYHALNWEFIASSGFAVGADIFDQQTTLRGLKRGACAEANVGGYLSHPSAGRLYAQNLPIDAGLILFGYWMRRKHVPLVPYAPLLTAGAKHLDGGIRWYTAGCL